MTTFVALLRAVNVGGTGKLPMSELAALAKDCGFEAVRTYIASGNLLFESRASEAKVKAALEAKLPRHGILIRSASEMTDVVAANPFGRPAGRPRRRDLPRRPAARRSGDASPESSRRADRPRQAGDICLLSGRDGPDTAGHPSRQGGHRAEHEHRDQAGRVGRAVRLEPLQPRVTIPVI